MNATLSARPNTAVHRSADVSGASGAGIGGSVGVPIGVSTGAPARGGVCWHEMVSHRNYLVRFAQRRLRDPLLAEDAVHDVFEAVLSGRAVFAGRSALRSWLTAVLKHKIVDVVRQSAGTDSLDAASEGDDPLELACPQPGPDQIAEAHELLTRTLARIRALPVGLRDVMQMRVLEEQPTQTVCRTLGISEENLFVRLHRARRQLAC